MLVNRTLDPSWWLIGLLQVASAQCLLSTEFASASCWRVLFVSFLSYVGHKEESLNPVCSEDSFHPVNWMDSFEQPWTWSCNFSSFSIWLQATLQLLWLQSPCLRCTAQEGSAFCFPLSFQSCDWLTVLNVCCSHSNFQWCQPNFSWWHKSSHSVLYIW